MNPASRATMVHNKQQIDKRTGKRLWTERGSRGISEGNASPQTIIFAKITGVLRNPQIPHFIRGTRRVDRLQEVLRKEISPPARSRLTAATGEEKEVKER